MKSSDFGWRFENNIDRDCHAFVNDCIRDNLLTVVVRISSPEIDFTTTRHFKFPLGVVYVAGERAE